VNAFYQLENYLRTIEKMKKGNYTLIHVNSDRQDYGLLSSVNKSFAKHKLSFGADYRNGSVYGIDKYQTSTDKVINKGKMQHVNLYFQDEFSFTEKFRGIAAIQFSHIRFSDGAFLLENATGATDFMNDFTGELDAKNWNGWSPSLSLQYDFTNNLNVYAIASRGFRAASLDDLTRTGFINIGYKRANPNLEPEVINNIEMGLRFQKKKYRLSAQAYYSLGDDFMYYVATGETIFGGRKKVFEKRNISNVEIMGLEAEAQYRLSELLSFSTNYTYNQSTIKKFEERSDLQGNTLTYSPNHIFNFSALISNNKWSSSINIHWQSKMFLDEANIFVVNDLMGIDLRLAYQFYKGIGAGVNMNNVLDEQHLVSSDQVSLGRFITFELFYQL
jgi:iron complex outermembrane receptor protein